VVVASGVAVVAASGVAVVGREAAGTRCLFRIVASCVQRTAPARMSLFLKYSPSRNSTEPIAVPPLTVRVSVPAVLVAHDLETSSKLHSDLFCRLRHAT
jgi:hypothetical protein